MSPTIEPVSSCRRRLPVEQEGIKRAHMEESIDARLMKFPVSNKKKIFLVDERVKNYATTPGPAGRPRAALHYSFSRLVFDSVFLQK